MNAGAIEGALHQAMIHVSRFVRCFNKLTEEDYSLENAFLDKALEIALAIETGDGMWDWNTADMLRRSETAIRAAKEIQVTTSVLNGVAERSSPSSKEKELIENMNKLSHRMDRVRSILEAQLG